jgi:CRP-like cAMP-binding protein
MGYFGYQRSTAGVTSRLARRLERYSPLSPAEKQSLETVARDVRRFDARSHMAKSGTPVDGIFAIIEGFACRYKLLPDGRRQILAFLLPGDLCDTRSFVLATRDHSLCALSPVDAAYLSREAVQRLEELPGLNHALACNSLVQQSIAREWLVNIGHRTSFERLSHLLCEIFVRLDVVGLAREYTCEVPLTQTEIADTLALSAVHVNRTLMELRRAGILSFHNRQLVIHDYTALREAAGFEPSYLQLEQLHAVAPPSPAERIVPLSH